MLLLCNTKLLMMLISIGRGSIWHLFRSLCKTLMISELDRTDRNQTLAILILLFFLSKLSDST